MNLIIFGATGMVGKQLVKQALYMGHHVKAYGRNVFTENLPEHKELELTQGALFDEKQVFKAIKGCDAVLSALGGSFDGTDVTRSLGMKNIVAQMQKANVKRIIGIGNLGILNVSATDNTLIMDQPEFKPEYIPVSLEHFKAYNFLKASALDWTFVGSPDIIDAEVTGNYTTNADYPPFKNKFRINSGDLAMFMLKEMTANEYLQHRVGISN
ncbi:NAD(P)-dependent oxidoreductase [Ferruginibacter sp.]|uniref:NAD(P)-dependent oxidoreductase n=1 Tax=Ferruginibacter sp. TaxID=1940288 RepID=UPI0019CE0073|nr:SDR family oxidoreductase [Ferruginibacter sp.]MBC7625862.1 SDR family oxidoreductase [Ferruginibacter sp.]